VIAQPDWALKTGVKLVPVIQLRVRMGIHTVDGRE
jgi:hypothetical protein